MSKLEGKVQEIMKIAGQVNSLTVNIKNQKLEEMKAIADKYENSTEINTELVPPSSDLPKYRLWITSDNCEIIVKTKDYNIGKFYTLKGAYEEDEA